jgi:hypothetical protein
MAVFYQVTKGCGTGSLHVLTERHFIFRFPEASGPNVFQRWLRGHDPVVVTFPYAVELIILRKINYQRLAHRVQSQGQENSYAE